MSNHRFDAETTSARGAETHERGELVSVAREIRSVIREGQRGGDVESARKCRVVGGLEEARSTPVSNI